MSCISQCVHIYDYIAVKFIITLVYVSLIMLRKSNWRSSYIRVSCQHHTTVASYIASYISALNI